MLVPEFIAVKELKLQGFSHGPRTGGPESVSGCVSRRGWRTPSRSRRIWGV